MLDAVVTDDADIFVFGASCVVRNRSVACIDFSQIIEQMVSSTIFKGDRDAIQLYKADHDATGLTRGDFILMALLIGGDYDRVSHWAHVDCPTVPVLNMSRVGLLGVVRQLRSALQVAQT